MKNKALIGTLIALVILVAGSLAVANNSHFLPLIPNKKEE